MALILLAEDETSTIDHVRSVLASQGWLVKTVKSRAQALRAASEFAPQLVLLNDELKGVDDLIRTFSRQNRGPGVVLLSTRKDSPTAGEDIEGILTKPLQTEELIEMIKDKLSTATDKKASTDTGTDVRILSSEEIFGDLLDDILDKDEAQEAAAPEEESSTKETVEEEVEEVVTTAKPAAASDDDGLVDLSDLEELAKEAVPALVDAVEAQARQKGEPEEELDVAELLRQTAPSVASPEPEPAPAAVELDEDLEAKLSDTLAGVLAASLGASRQPEVASTDDGSAYDVDNLLSQALGDLDIGKTTTREEPAVQPAADAEEEEEEEEKETPEETAGGGFELVEEQLGEEEDDEPDIPVREAEEGDLSKELAELASEDKPETAAEQAIEFGEYSLEKRIGLGGMAEVWKARRKGVEGFEKRVAIKKILPQPAENQDFVDMFIDEAKLAAQLNHKNITHIYDLGKVDDDYFIAMEYVEGQNLRHLLDAGRKTDKSLPAGLALYIASRIADALDYAHRSKDFNNTELGLVHRDVSPHNVLISYEGDIKLCDFGIAKAVSKISTTQMGALKGKLQYMSPEQAWGRSIDHRSDIFSTGTLLFEMLTGKRLFTGDSELAVLEAVRECDTAERVIQDPAIPSRVKGLLLKTLAKETEERYETAGELLGGLEELLAEYEATPGQREMSSYVRELLDLPETAERQSKAEEPDRPTGVPVAEPTWEETWEELSDPSAILLQKGPIDLEGEEAIDEEGRRQPAFLKWLSRLLPVVAVLAIGGYLIAGRWGESPARQSSSEAARPRFAETEIFRPEAVEASLALDPDIGGVSAFVGTETAPVAAPTPAREQPTAPPRAQNQQPEGPIAATTPTGAAAIDARSDSEQSQVDVAGSESAQDTQAVSTDPELERRVEQDLQRVQELISTPDFASSQLQEAGSEEEPITEFAEPTPASQGVATDDTDALIQEADFDPSVSDELAATNAKDGSPIADGFASLDSESGGIEGSPPLTAEVGEPPESTVSAIGAEAVDSSPDLPIAPPAEESTATQPGDLVEQGPGVIGPQVQSFRPPPYSEMARRVGASGTVRVAVLVDENGQVLEARLVEGMRQKVGLDEQTLAAARRATFRAATKDGVPVKMWHELAVQFQP
ncbi:MAG: TonB family protein [Thermoanaerobaculia bacterium]